MVIGQISASSSKQMFKRRQVSPSSTRRGLQSHPNGGMSFSAWRWARQHPADDTRGTYRSTLGSVSTGHHRPTAAVFSESGGKARTRRCWRTCLVYLSDADKQQLIINYKSALFSWTDRKHLLMGPSAMSVGFVVETLNLSNGKLWAMGKPRYVLACWGSVNTFFSCGGHVGLCYRAAGSTSCISPSLSLQDNRTAAGCASHTRTVCRPAEIHAAASGRCTHETEEHL